MSALAVKRTVKVGAGVCAPPLRPMRVTTRRTGATGERPPRVHRWIGGFAIFFVRAAALWRLGDQRYHPCIKQPGSRAMPNNLSSFAIHVDDTDRARAFYEAVFGWRFEAWGPPDFYLIH